VLLLSFWGDVGKEPPVRGQGMRLTTVLANLHMKILRLPYLAEEYTCRGCS